MKSSRAIIFGLVLFTASVVAYKYLPNQYKYEVNDWFSSLGAPSFIESPDYFSARNQSDIIREYQNRNYQLKCYGNLRHEEKISKQDDYLCFAYISSAYDNIPAKLVTFFFSKNKLSHVRLEVPDSSFSKLQNYLARKLANYPRLDLLPNHNFGTDNFGNPLMVWAVKEGLITTSTISTAGQNEVLLWSSIEQETLNTFR